MYIAAKPCCKKCADHGGSCADKAKAAFRGRPVIRSTAGMPFELGQWEWIGAAISAATNVGGSIFTADQQRKQQHDAQDTALKIAQLQANAAPTLPPFQQQASPVVPPVNYYPPAQNSSKLLVYGGLAAFALVAVLLVARR